MKLYVVLGLLLVSSACKTTAPKPPPEMPPTPAPELAAEHAWLAELAGEWKAEFELPGGADAPPMDFEVNEEARMIGGSWLVLEHRGGPSTGIMTLGYDTATKRFVGTWIDSTSTYLWRYDGALDDTRKVLSLAAEGPGFDDPTKMMKYKDVITLVSHDHKTLTSSVQGSDGSWTPFLTVHYRRVN